MLFLLTCFSFLFSSNSYFDADPFYLFYYENQQFEQQNFDVDLNIRPAFKSDYDDQMSLSYNTWYYYNDNAPNLENTSNRYVGKGSSFYHSMHFDYFNDFVLFSIEPYNHMSENLHFINQHSNPIFQALNDGAAHSDKPYNSYGLRESQFIVHYKDYGIGISNTNMWWGPGIHNSLHMSNNTTGFKYFFLGTTSPKKIKSLSYSLNYVFSKLDKNLAEPYFTGLAGDITYHSEQIITLGFFRSFLSGGNLTSDQVGTKDAMLLPFQKFFKNGLESDQTDQTASLFASFLFPKSKFKLFIEVGMNDHRWDVYDFLQHPDHTIASIIGFRKYGFFNNPNYIMGFEYTNLRKTRYDNRATPNWYDRSYFDNWLFDGRRFAAHSGSDSDDLLIYIGHLSQLYDLIASFNYERHGITESVDLSLEQGFFYVPEYKLEFKIDVRKKYKDFDIFFLYEFEFVDNLGIVIQGIDERLYYPRRKANIFGFGFSKTIK